MSTWPVDIPPRPFAIATAIVVDCSLYFVEETAASNSKAVARTVTLAATFVEARVGNTCEFAEAMAPVGYKCATAEEMAMVGNSCGTVEVMETVEDSFEIAKVMATVESNCLVVLAEVTFASNFVAFEASVLNVSNSQIVAEKAGNT